MMRDYKHALRFQEQIPTLLEGGFVERGDVLAFGLPGRGKSHFVAALCRELILRHGQPVLFIPTSKLVHHATILEFAGESVRTMPLRHLCRWAQLSCEVTTSLPRGFGLSLKDEVPIPSVWSHAVARVGGARHGRHADLFRQV
jgi:hypothetical protein